MPYFQVLKYVDEMKLLDILTRGHPFMASTKNDQFFYPSPTPIIRKNER